VPVIREGRIWGRGTGDNKGQHFAHLQALRLLLETDGGYPCSVKFILDGEEEVGSPHLAALVTDNADLLAADVVIWSDGPVHESGRWCVVHGVRGALAVRLTCRGAAARCIQGTSATSWRIRRGRSCRRWHRCGTRPAGSSSEGFYDDVPPVPDADEAAYAGLPLDLARVLAGAGVAEMDPAHGSWTTTTGSGRSPR